MMIYFIVTAYFTKAQKRNLIYAPRWLQCVAECASLHTHMESIHTHLLQAETAELFFTTFYPQK